MISVDIKGIPSYFFQHFFEIAKSTFKVKEKNLYCTLMQAFPGMACDRTRTRPHTP